MGDRLTKGEVAGVFIRIVALFGAAAEFSILASAAVDIVFQRGQLDVSILCVDGIGLGAAIVIVWKSDTLGRWLYPDSDNRVCWIRRPGWQAAAIGLPLLVLVVLTLFFVHNIRERTRDPIAAISRSRNVPWLEGIANGFAEPSGLEIQHRLGRGSKHMRTAAYARLGELCTKESLAAIGRLEQRIREFTPTDACVPIGESPHPCWHFGDGEIEAHVQTKAADGTTYAAVESYLLGASDLFLISSKTPYDVMSWSRPKLMPGRIYRGMHDMKLTFKDQGMICLSFVQEAPPQRYLMEGTFDPGATAKEIGSQERVIALAEVLRDTDGDGWTDLEEQRLGLDPNLRDTDCDGLVDGSDTCPDFAPPVTDANDEEVQILQKAIFATFGLTGSRMLLIVGPESRKLQVWGYRGPIIYRDETKNWREEHEYGGVFAGWDAKRSGDTARVDISDYEGPLAAGSQHVYLKKVNGQWLVTKTELGAVS